MTPISPPTLLRVTEEHGRTTARFADCKSLNEDNAEAVARELGALVTGRDRPLLTLDLGQIDFLTSVVLGKFVALNGKVRATGGRLDLVNLTPTVRQVFAVTRLDRVLNIGVKTDALSA